MGAELRTEPLKAATPAGISIERFAANPLITPEQVTPSQPGWEILGVFNPGVFRHEHRLGLVLRVAERPPQEAGWLSVPVMDPAAEGGMRVLRWRLDDPLLDARDPRIVSYDGDTYLTSISHLRLAWSTDGVTFAIDTLPAVTGQGPQETFGCDDARVARINGTWYLTYSVASPMGVAVGMSSTRDWRSFTHHGNPLCPDNKDCALFEERLAGHYWCLHRPSNVHIPGNHIWLASSPDLHHWGHHLCLAMTRPGMWDAARIGGCGSPIRTERGWLVIYHGANAANRYCLGAMLLDLHDPRRVIKRLEQPIMVPETDDERHGFMPDVIFNNGHDLQGDTLTLYYGACDERICGARVSLSALLALF